jgi:hypothetical protein
VDHDLQEVFQRLLGICGEACVYRRGLHHGASGRNQPAEPLARRQEAYGARLEAACAYQASDFQVSKHSTVVETRVERSQAVGVQVHACVEEVCLSAVEHYTRVDELLALYPRHHPQQGILK